MVISEGVNGIMSLYLVYIFFTKRIAVDACVMANVHVVYNIDCFCSHLILILLQLSGRRLKFYLEVFNQL